MRSTVLPLRSRRNEEKVRGSDFLIEKILADDSPTSRPFFLLSGA